MSVGKYIGSFQLCPMADGITWYPTYSFQFIRPNGFVVNVPAGFETDFASVPRVLWNIFPPWGVYGPASVVHDSLYGREGAVGAISKEEADKVFLEAMETSGVPFLKRWTLYLAVKEFGQHAWDSDGVIASQGISRIYTGTDLLPGWSRNLDHGP